MRRLLPSTLLAGSLLLTTFTAASMSSGPHSVAAIQATDRERLMHLLHQPVDCFEALIHFSGNQDTARRIVWRESRNQPTAQNDKSTAAGCFQLLAMHAWRFEEVGCSWTQRYEPACNTRAADHLYQDAGWNPWTP